MKKIKLIAALLVVGLAACKKESPTPQKTNNTVTPPKKSQLGMLCQTWVLKETFENDVRKTTGGTDQYKYTKQGKFLFLYDGSWMEIGTYDFSRDSTSISVLFMGSSTSTSMKLKTLDDKDLKTEFTVNGKKLNYNYKRE